MAQIVTTDPAEFKELIRLLAGAGYHLPPGVTRESLIPTLYAVAKSRRAAIRQSTGDWAPDEPSDPSGRPAHPGASAAIWFAKQDPNAT